MNKKPFLQLQKLSRGWLAAQKVQQIKPNNYD